MQVDRDARRRLELKNNRNRGGRPPGETPVRFHKKRFEAALWLTLVRIFKFRPTHAARQVVLMLHLRDPATLQDLGHGFAKLSGESVNNPEERCHDIARTARLLEKRAKDDEDLFWLLGSQIELFHLLRPNSAQSRSRQMRAAQARLRLSFLGWEPIFAAAQSRLSMLPDAMELADSQAIAAFAKRFKSRGLSFGR